MAQPPVQVLSISSVRLLKIHPAKFMEKSDVFMEIIRIRFVITGFTV